MSNLPDQLLVSDGRDELIAQLFGLKDWMTYIGRFSPDTTDNMYRRSCAISDEFYGTGLPTIASRMETRPFPFDSRRMVSKGCEEI